MIKEFFNKISFYIPTIISLIVSIFLWDIIKFKFNNPNEVSACGCGESVEIVPLDSVPYVSTAS